MDTHESENRRDQAGEDNADPRHEAERHAAYLLGQCVGIEDAAGRLRVKSGELFAQGNDERACMFRGLANDLSSHAKKVRITHDIYRKEHGLT